MTQNPLSPRERRRRVVLLCCSFARHLAVYRAGFTAGAQLFQPNAPGFWRVINGSCLDICILEWCKIFAEPSGKHFWKRVISEANWPRFEAELEASVGISAAEFRSFAIGVRYYRDKFIAHLDDQRGMNIPRLTHASRSVWCLYEFLIRNECEAGDLAGLIDGLDKFESGYQECYSQAESVFIANSPVAS